MTRSVFSLGFTLIASLAITCYGANPSQWMKDLWSCVGSKSLLDLTLPGTHDSGAYDLTAELVPGYAPDNIEALIYAAEAKGIPLDVAIIDWSEAQDQDFYNQLKGGIRYFDLRSAWDSNSSSWRTFHFAYGNTIQVLLDDIARFLEEYPSEFVVVETSHLDGSPSTQDVKNLISQIETTFGSKLFPRTQSLTLPLEDILSNGWNVLVSLESDLIADHPSLWYSSAFVNSYADSCDLDTMVDYNHNKAKEFQGFTSEALYKISWTLTPHADCIIRGIRPRYPWGLIAVADTANDEDFDNYIAWLKEQQLRAGHIFIIDHYESSSIVESMEYFNCL